MAVKENNNPFKVFSPEHLDPSDVVDLFVVDSPGVDSIQSDGHAMLVGARGAGKSMLLRYMEPDCQLIVHGHRTVTATNSNLSQLPYYMGYLTIRETELSLPSLRLIADTHANSPLNESILIITVCLNLVSRSIKNNHFPGEVVLPNSVLAELIELVNKHGGDWNFDDKSTLPITELRALSKLKSWLSSKYDEFIDYLDTLIPDRDVTPYNQKLFRFSSFLVSFVRIFKQFPSMPKTQRFFLAIDDSDKLSDIQTRILNSWLARRNSDFSLKVSYEMYGYKTFYTVAQTRIEAPHDYQELKISDVYTSNIKTNFRDRMYQIVNKRLAKAGFIDGNSAPNARKFFPEDHAQRVAIEKLAKSLRSSSENSRSSRARDDVYRYVIPNYISRLGGISKNRSTYKYSGFDQLVDISSGVPRYFLDAAQKMFDRQLVINQSSRSKILEISPSVQDSVVRDQARELLIEELEKLKLDWKKATGPDIALMLHNLIGSVGALFETLLLNEEASERRVFSFAISDHPDELVQEVLRLGLSCAYFSRSSIGRKEGFGRTEKYILSRRFAPNWNLDPSGFSAYKFLTNADLRAMMTQPEQYRLRLRRNRTAGSKGNDEQMAIQFGEDDQVD
ncbi:hypothetical protein C8J38_1022 [Rhizobium sp. PP-WC-2G-219]|nr:hypothetical protein C8J38_1022 [Rhizobium sp. PP-WC-2G-219]